MWLVLVAVALILIAASSARAGETNMITSDPSSWPSGDRIWDIARAIAYAEGYNLPSSVPFRLNDPGDISDWASIYGSETHSGSNVTTFPDAETGWNKLYDKLQNIATGASSAYNARWTWTRIAQTWAGDWQAWLNNVTAHLGVSPDSSFADYVNG
jgi:hypothetical protein